MKKSTFLFSFMALFFYGITYANNLQITNLTRVSANQISFDVSWDNSWNLVGSGVTPLNWDAVWIFVKVQDCNTQIKAWEHADVSIVSGNHSVSGSVLQIDGVTDGKGVFIRRQNIGAGSIAPATVTLEFQNSYGMSNVNFQVFGIEMVAVLQGAFELGGTTGSYSSSSAGAYAYKNNYQVTSENQINAGDLLTDGSAVNAALNSYNPDIPASFPKGYNQFYCMKYEVSQEQYVRFLNLLNYAQQAQRTTYPPNSPVGTNAISGHITTPYNRNGIRIETPGSLAPNNSPAVYSCDLNNNQNFNEVDDGQNIACNYLSWEDLMAYLDWAALRPMTELEYEKASRGPLPAVTNEFAWGNDQYSYASSNSISNGGTPSEISNTTPTPPNGLAAMGSSSLTSYGPLRVGFAATSAPTREGSGASYWGILDMTGNVWEQCVATGYANGNISNFTGVLGDGEISSSGNADQTGWSANELHRNVRGGSWAMTYYYARLGNRGYIGTSTYNGRNNQNGGRGVRQF